MIAKAKSISHGINDIRYITGESRNKKHPERIYHVKDNLLPPGLDATGIWDSMRLTLAKSRRVKIPSSASRSAPRRSTRRTSLSTTGGSCGTTSSTSSTTSNCVTRTAEPIPRRPISEAARVRYGCTRNPKAAFPTFTARSAASTGRGVSTTTTTSICARSGRPSVWP